MNKKLFLFIEISTFLNARFGKWTWIKFVCSLGYFLLFSLKSFSQSDSSIHLANSKMAQPKKWYDNFSIRGYTQVRYNRLLETNEDLGCEQCD